MPRPSRNLDLALLQAGRELFPQAGCAKLSVRAVAERAGANVGMFHYHFKSKDNFLRALLQQVYEEIFAGLSQAAARPGKAIDGLRAALVAAAGLLAMHRKVIARVWMDAVSGEPVATEFVRRNAPRHIGLLLELVRQAQHEGALRDLPPLQCVAMLMGAVALPVVFVAGLVEVAMPVAAFQRQFGDHVMSEQAIAQRVDLALGALRAAPMRRRSPSTA
jgi:AcrR family transcriptional regulator